jgi:hypothetical protein
MNTTGISTTHFTQHIGQEIIHTSAPAGVDAAGLLVAIAEVAMTNDMFGHAVSAESMQSLGKVMTNAMVDASLAAITDPNMSSYEAQHSLVELTINGAQTAYGNAYSPAPSLADYTEAIQLVGQTIGYHLPFEAFGLPH